MADPVAPYGLSGVVTGERAPDPFDAAISATMADHRARNKPSTMQAVNQGVAQGGSLGLVDEAMGGLDTLASKIPGVRDVAEGSRNFLRRHLGPDVIAPSLPLTDPSLTYEQRRDYYRGADAAAREAHPIAHLGGELAGSLVTPGGTLGKAVGTGAVAGVGHSEATDPLAQAADALKGGAAGAGGYAVGKAIGAGVSRIVKGAPGRDDARAMKAVTDGVRSKVANRIATEKDRMLGVLREPNVRTSLGDPAKMTAAAEQGLSAEGTVADGILSRADKAAAAAAGVAGHGGLRVSDVAAPLEQLKNELVRTSQNPAAVRAIDGVIDQFRTGIGRDNNALVPAARVREFLTQQIQRPAFKGDPMNPDTTPVQEALQRASGVVKDALKGHVHKHLSETAVAGLQRSWDRSMAFNLLGQAAEQQAVQGTKSPGPATAIARALMGHKAEGVGATLGYSVGGPVGAMVGAAAGAGAKKLPPLVDEKLATEAGQAAGRAAASRAPGVAARLSQPVIDALTTKDEAAGKAALAREIFGE